MLARRGLRRVHEMSSSLRVKICGLTSPEDAQLAVALGADALGFVFWSDSPRCVSVERAEAICRAVPAFVTRVGVFVNSRPEDVRTIADAVGLDAIQLHGDEPVDAFRGISRRILRLATLTTPADIDRVLGFPEDVTPLVDAIDPRRRGGTGTVADWKLARDLARLRPIVLAGGLTVANLREACQAVRPWAVDVSSGVEAQPGRKSEIKLRAFLAEAHAIEESA